MNARGLGTLDRTWQAITARADHAGHVRDLSLAQLARRVGVTQRHMQTVMQVLESGKRFVRNVRRGFTNRYQLLTPWTRAMLDGEARRAELDGVSAPVADSQAGAGHAAASEPVPPPSSRPPWFGLSRELLEHHPTL